MAAIRLSSDYASTVGVRSVLNMVPVRKPAKTEFVRVRDDETWHLPTTVLELREENEIYLVAPALRDALADLIVPKMLYPTISRQGVVFIWPVGPPDHTGRTHRAHASARDAAEHARKAWVRLQWDPYLGGYRLHEARAEFGAPEWPDVTAEDLIQLAFKDRYIDSLEHPAIKRLRGEL